MEGIQVSIRPEGEEQYSPVTSLIITGLNPSIEIKFAKNYSEEWGIGQFGIFNPEDIAISIDDGSDETSTERPIDPAKRFIRIKEHPTEITRTDNSLLWTPATTSTFQIGLNRIRVWWSENSYDQANFYGGYILNSAPPVAILREPYQGIILANNDDDNNDHNPDNADMRVNGLGDFEDIAAIVFSVTPTDNQLTLRVSDEVVPTQKVRIFSKIEPNNAEVIIGPGSTTNKYTIKEKKNKYIFAIEGIEMGAEAEISLIDETISKIIATVPITVSSFIMLSNLADVEKLYVTKAFYRIINPVTLQPQLSLIDESNQFINDLERTNVLESNQIIKIDGINYLEHFDEPITREVNGTVITITDMSDIWPQDEFEIGYTSIPISEEGKITIHSMTVVFDSPRNGGLDPYPENELLGPNLGVFTMSGSDPKDKYHTAFGNLEVTPPISGYSFGRIFVGRTMSDTLKTFLNAQKIQAPIIEINNAWLHVGHVDEIISFVPAPSSKGFKILIASPSLAIEELRNLSLRGYGNTQFKGTEVVPIFDEQGNVKDEILETTIKTINEILNDPADLIGYNLGAQIIIDGILSELKPVLELNDDDIIKIPILFTSDNDGKSVAYTTNMVNSLMVGDNKIVMAEPYGPVINQIDVFKDMVIPLLQSLGLSISFIDDWDLYHLNEGEVHCGTNTKRIPPKQSNWWDK